jgi:hypothetical protein
MGTVRYFKVLNEDGSAIYGQGAWPLTVNGQPGEPIEVEGELVACQNGLHLCTDATLIEWLGPAIYEVEPLSVVVEQEDKHLTRRARLVRKYEAWNETSARRFAADCAEDVLPLFEAERPDDSRPRNAIVAARAYARSNISDAARDAAWDAARDAAWDAARDAARNAAGAAARDAARNAAWDAARDAAGAAAGAAAWDAAGDAARDAAWNAARNAARNAAWAAARNAAWAAAREWQTARLMNVLGGLDE